VGAGAASGAGQTAMSNLAGTAVGAGATSELFNAGTNAMNTYVNAVNGYNQSQAEFAQSQASEMSGIGQAIGGLTGLGFMKYAGMSDERAKTDIHREGTSSMGIPLYSFRYKGDPKSYPKVVGPMAQDIARIMPERVSAIPGSGGRLAINFQGGGDVGVGPSPDAQYTPTQGGGMSGTPGTAIPPQMPPGAMPGADSTPGGNVPLYASPSMGQEEDDVPAMLTAGEFVIPKDVMSWKGQEYFAKQIDQARQAQAKFDGRDDIGGEPTNASAHNPTFISRPGRMGAVPGGMRRSAIPMMPDQQAA